MRLFYSHTRTVEAAYIITLQGNSTSEALSARCAASCEAVGQPHHVWEAFDGIENPIRVPSHSEHSDLIQMVKVTDHYLTRGEVACFLSHLSLWRRCVLIDQPIVILEHDAVMTQAFETFDKFNSIIYLGGAEWSQWNWPQLPIPPHGTEGPNVHFICRAHAYAIDPAMAKNMISHVIEHGIYTSTDVLMRSDLFNITHQGSYAYDDHSLETESSTTILNRPALRQQKQRNDNLEI
jgi:hypothetical protein